MFTVGENIIYGSSGICKIIEITENNLTGTMHEYYVLQPVDTDKSVIYVPVDNEKLVLRMRNVPTKNELREILKDADCESIDWIENSLERVQTYRRILADGDIKTNITLLRTLHLRNLSVLEKGRHLPSSDERIYKDCLRLITSEFASIMHMEHDDVIKLILSNDK